MSDDTKVWTAKPRTGGSKSLKSVTPSTPSPAPTPPALESTPPVPPLPKSPRPSRPPLSITRKMLRAFGWSTLGLLGLLLGSAAWLTGPLGERTLTSLTVHLANKGMASTGLHMELASITGLWDGEIRFIGLKLLDKDGEWLDLAEGALYPQWGTVMRNALESARTLQKLKLNADPSGDGFVLVDLRRVTLFGLTLSRLPVLADSAPAAPTVPTVPGPIRILPSWLELDIGEFEMVRLGYGPKETRLFANIHANARLSDSQGEIRMGLFLSPSVRALQGAPLPEALPGDVTLSRRELSASNGGNTPGITSPDAGMGPLPLPEMENTPENQADSITSAPPTATQDIAAAPAAPASSVLPQAFLQALAPPAPQTDAPNTAQMVLNVVWDGTFADIRWQARDTLLLGQILPGIERVWSRTRVQCNVAEWPPSPKHPLQIRLASRFGLTVKDIPDRVRASLCTGQFFWDGQTLVARDVDLQVPLRDPHVLLQGSGGFSRASGPGVRMRLEVTELSKLVKALGLSKLEQSLGGGLVGAFAAGRGGRHTLWWTRPLPEPAGFENNALPGFTAAPIPPQLAKLEAEGQLIDHVPTLQNGNSHSDTSRNSKESSGDAATAPPTVTRLVTAPATASATAPVTLTVHDPRASRAPTALHTRISIESDKLKLPGGTVENLSLVLRGTSLDAETAPDGTMHRKAVQNAALHPQAPASAESAGSAKSAGSTRAAESVESTRAAESAAPAAPPSPTGKDSDSEDFAASGLPRGMVGALELKARSLFDLGSVDMRSQWMVGGLHGDADVFMMEFTKLAGKLPGFSLGGDVEMTYALPIRRPWPWLDGTLTVAVENWEALKRLIKSPLQGDGMGATLNMESRFNEKNEPRQYLRAEVKARQVNTPSFTVREVRGDVMSDHAHALADLFSLALSMPGQRRASPEGPPPIDYDLLKARLQLGSGSGGPVQWSSGLCTLSVAGENARIDANLKGNIRGMLEGVFNFRTRLLQIQKMEVSQGPENDAQTLKLRSPLVAALHENGGLKPVELSFRYAKGLEATARFAAQLQPLVSAKQGLSPTANLGATGAAAGRESRSAARSDNKNSASKVDGEEADPDSQTQKSTVTATETAAPVHRLLKAEAIVWGLPGQDAPGPNSASALRAQVELPLSFAPLPAPLKSAPLHAEVRWQGELAPLWKLLPMPGRSFSGTASLRAGVSGSLAAPKVQGAVTLRKAQYIDKLEGLRLQDITMNAEYGGAQLSRFDLSAADGRGGSLDLRGALIQQGTALMINAEGSLKALRPLHRDDVSVTLSGDLALRGPLFTMMPRALSVAATDTTTATTAATATSTHAVTPLFPQAKTAMPAHLLLSGRVRLDQGSFQLLQGFSPSVPSLEGVVEGAKPPPLSTITATGIATDIATDIATGFATGTPTVTQPATHAVMKPVTKRKRDTRATKNARDATATATPHKAPRATVSTKSGSHEPASPESGSPESDSPGILLPQLDISIDAPGQFFIRGKGLDSEWRAALRVEGSVAAPRLLGSFSPVRGTFELLNRQFRFEGGGIHFNGAWPPNPSLDLSLGYKSPQITALIQVLGSVRRPKLDLTSQPPVPRDEVMAQVLFGKKMESLSRFETLQAANAARQLVEMGPSALDVLSTARDALGLEVLRLGKGTAEGTKSAPRDASMRGQTNEGQDLGTTLEAGKYITDSIYVGVEQGTKPEAGTAVRVEVDLTPNMSLTGRTSQESSGVGINWKMDY